IYTFTWNLVVSNRLMDQPETLKNIIRALHVAERYSQENPKEAMEITARYLRMSTEQIREAWGGIEAEVTLRQSLIINLERQIKWDPDRQRKNPVPDLMNYIYPAPIKAIVPDKVTYIE